MNNSFLYLYSLCHMIWADIHLNSLSQRKRRYRKLKNWMKRLQIINCHSYTDASIKKQFCHILNGRALSWWLNNFTLKCAGYLLTLFRLIDWSWQGPRLNGLIQSITKCRSLATCLSTTIPPSPQGSGSRSMSQVKRRQLQLSSVNFGVHKWWATCDGFHKISFRVVKQEVSREGKIQYWINLAAKNCKCFECFLESSNCTPMPYMHTLRIYFVVVTQRRILFCLRKMRGNLSRLIRHTSFNFVSCYRGKSSIHFGRKHNWQSLYVETVAKNCKLLMTS